MSIAPLSTLGTNRSQNENFAHLRRFLSMLATICNFEVNLWEYGSLTVKSAYSVLILLFEELSNAMLYFEF